MEYVWKVYKVTASDGRGYIGITRNTVAWRWDSHVRAAKNTRIPFYDAILDLGANAFTVETLCECFSEWEARKCERAMIALHDTHYKGGRGFNRSIGGNGNTGGASEETRAKIGAKTRAWLAADPERRFRLIRTYNAMGRPVSEEGQKRKLEGLRSAHKPEIWEKGAAKRRGVKQSEDRAAKSRANLDKGREAYRIKLWRERNYSDALASRCDRSKLVRPRKKRLYTPQELENLRMTAKATAARMTPEQHKKKGRPGRPIAAEHLEKFRQNMAKARAALTPEIIRAAVAKREANRKKMVANDG